MRIRPIDNSGGMVWIKYRTEVPNQTAVKAFHNTANMAEWLILNYKEVAKILLMWKE